MKSGYKVCDAMTAKPITVKKNSCLMECASKMKKNRVGVLIINDKVLSIITEQDIVREGVANNLNPKKAMASEVMTNLEHTIEPQQDVFEALTKMRDFDIRHLPVVDNKKMVGLITLKDILKIEPQIHDLLTQKLNQKEEEEQSIKDQIKEKEGVCNICGNYSDNLKEKNYIFFCKKCSES